MRGEEGVRRARFEQPLERCGRRPRGPQRAHQRPRRGADDGADRHVGGLDRREHARVAREGEEPAGEEEIVRRAVRIPPAVRTAAHHLAAVHRNDAQYVDVSSK